MKTRIFILRKDNNVIIVKRNKINNPFEIKGNYYFMEEGMTFSNGKKRYLFLSEARINPIRTMLIDGKEREVCNLNYLTENTSEFDRIYQILLHNNALKQILPREDNDLFKILSYIGIGLILGIILTLSFAHLIR